MFYLTFGVLHGDRQAAALRNTHLCRNVDIEIVFHGSRRHRRCGAGQRLAVYSQRGGDGSHGSASGNGDVAAVSDFVQRSALVRQPAQRHHSGALTVHDARLAVNRGFRQRHIKTDPRKGLFCVWEVSYAAPENRSLNVSRPFGVISVCTPLHFVFSFRHSLTSKSPSFFAS